MRDRLIAPDSERLADQLDGLRDVAGLQRYESREVQRIEVPRLEPQDASAELFGVDQLALPEARECALKSLCVLIHVLRAR